MPDRERTRERSDRKRIYSAVVVSKSFQKVEDKRDPSKERRERRFRQRSPDDVRESDRAAQRMHMDRDENSREHRRQKISERLGHRTRKGDVHEENEDKDESSSSRWKERNQRYSQRGRGPPLTNQQRRTVFDRLDSGPARDRGFVRNPQGGGPRDQGMVEVEVEVNPQDVPRGKRYFMHDDRELPRRQKSDRSRARSRSPLWVHDRFDDDPEGDEDQEEKAAQDDSGTAKQQQDREIIQERQRDRERRKQEHHRN
ncbi:hypothetical protein OS493_019516 [Desmophyllum pertusum]|uniref:Uncharacterized protein n=1 Tax=Desmophyllum pertusum TaxID=174260 RepID=A0A9X0D4S6_9CNID|nr:hypothetical protein OS493_019516 [Desmophyllum pertusum]